MRSILAATTFGLALMLCASTVFADGTQTGVVSGRVLDATDTPLPGVEVTIAGSQTRRTVVTDDLGRFRFPALAVGGYDLVAALLGLEARQQGLRVYIDKTTEVELRLQAASIAEETTTTGEATAIDVLAPIIDPFEIRVGTSVNRGFLDQLPITRLYQGVALLLPGVVGGEDGNPNVDGALRGANRFLIDGVDTTDSTTGLFGLNLSYEAIQDVDVTTAAASVEYGRVSGAVINVVTRSGTNRYHGSLDWLLSRRSWNADYSDSAPALRDDLEAANEDPGDPDTTVVATLGGPVLRDRLWFFTAFENAESGLVRPVLGGGRWDETPRLTSTTAKLTWQVTPQHSVIGQWTADDGDFGAFTPFARDAGENRTAGSRPGVLQGAIVEDQPGDIFALQQRSQDGFFGTVRWQAAFSQNLSLNASLARQDRELENRARNNRGLTGGAPHFGVLSAIPLNEFVALIDEIGLYNGITDHGFEHRQRSQANISFDGYLRTGTVDHGLRVGIDFQRTESERTFNFDGTPGIDRALGRPVTGQLFIDIDPSDTCFQGGACNSFDPETGSFAPWALLNFWRRDPRQSENESMALYVEDAISFGRMLVSAGLRWEREEGSDEVGRTLTEDDGIAPRIGVKVDPKGDGRSLFSASWARYHEPFPQRLLDDFARNVTFSGYTEYRWEDRLDPAADCSGEDPTDLGSRCWIPLFYVPFAERQPAPPNTDLRRSAVDEFTVGFEHQLTRHAGLRVHWIDRRWQNLWDDRFRFGPDGNVISSIENLRFAKRRYRALQVLLQKRFADSWQMLGAYTWSEAEGNLFQNDAFDTFADFDETTDANLINRFGPAPYDRRHQLKTYASYLQPLGRADLIIGGAFLYQSGAPYQRIENDPFGFRFLTPRGALDLPDVYQLDLSLSYELPLPKGTAFSAKLEIFNVSDQQERLQVDSVVDNETFGDPRLLVDLQAPRSLRLTLGLRF